MDAGRGDDNDVAGVSGLEGRLCSITDAFLGEGGPLSLL